MPFIHIKSLPMKSSNISTLIVEIAQDFAENTGIELQHIHTTWEFYPPGHYAKGDKVADVQPEVNFPLIVDLLTPDFNEKSTIKRMLETIAESISKRAQFPRHNIFINHRQAHSEMVFDDGEIVRWRRAMRKNEDKKICRTPTLNKKPTKIDRWKYDVIRSAILQTLSKNENGVLFKDLSALVAQELSDELKAKLGSISWYTTTVKLELEVGGEIQRIPGVKPQRIIAVA